MAELKIMFWNIHNAYSYKVRMLTADDEAAEEDDQAQGANGGEAQAGEESKKDEPQRVERLFRLRNREVSKKVSEVVKNINPDLVVLVDYSLGQYKLITDDDNTQEGEQGNPGNGNPPEDNTPSGESGSQVTFFDRFGPYQYKSDLNNLYKKDGSKRAWDVQLVAMNASDLFKGKATAFEKGKATAFELYSVLWDKAKLKAEEHLATETDGKKGKLTFQPRSPATTLFSLKDQPETKFRLFVFHGPTKKKDATKDERVTSIKNLSALKKLDEAINGTKKTKKMPLLLAGNFNLDRDDPAEKVAYKPLEDLGLKARINGKTEFAKKAQGEKAEPAADEGDAKPEAGKAEDADKLELTSACNIFTLNFEEGGSQGSIYDFIKEDCENDVDQALAVSNHLPIHVTVRL